MHSYVEQVSYLPMYAVEERKAAGRRPMRVIVAASSFAAMACIAVLLVASEGGQGVRRATELVPKFVDWKKEDAGSDDMNLHLKVADALAKVGKCTILLCDAKTAPKIPCARSTETDGACISG